MSKSIINIWDSFLGLLGSRQLRQMQQSIKDLRDVVTEHQQLLDAHRIMFNELAHGLDVLGRAIANITENNNQMIPHVCQLQSNQTQLINAYKQLIEVLIEEGILEPNLPNFHRFH